jgi:hypothetical protein
LHLRCLSGSEKDLILRLAEILHRAEQVGDDDLVADAAGQHGAEGGQAAWIGLVVEMVLVVAADQILLVFGAAEDGGSDQLAAQAFGQGLLPGGQARDIVARDSVPSSSASGTQINGTVAIHRFSCKGG